MRGRKEVELASHLSAENGLGTTIRAWRRFHGLTVTELAVRSGFGKNGRGYISRIEHSQIRHLGEERLNRIASVLKVQSADLLLHHMPETHAEAPTYDLDEAIIGAKALLKKCTTQPFDRARIQLLLAKLFSERATSALMAAQKHSALTEAQQCIQDALCVFTPKTAPKSYQEATKLDREIGKALESSIVDCCAALMKRCPPQSLDRARIQLMLARFHYERAAALQDTEAKSLLIEAQQFIEAAQPIFAQKKATRNLKETKELSREIQFAIEEIEVL